MADESIAAFPRDAAAVANALIVPIVATVVRIELPIVARCIIATLPVEWRVEVLELCGAGVSDAIHKRIYRMPIRGGVDRHGHRGVLRPRGCGQDPKKKRYRKTTF